jgi:hypothetical protein
MYLILKRHLTDLAPRPVPVTHILRVLPFKVLCQVARSIEFVDEVLYCRIIQY